MKFDHHTYHPYTYHLRGNFRVGWFRAFHGPGGQSSPRRR
jgi:hypothetical protein